MPVHRLRIEPELQRVGKPLRLRHPLNHGYGIRSNGFEHVRVTSFEFIGGEISLMVLRRGGRRDDQHSEQRCDGFG